MNDGIMPEYGRKRKSFPSASQGKTDGERHTHAHRTHTLTCTPPSSSNAKAPMPDLIISPSSTCPGAFAPPSAAFKPALRILKRPSPSSSQPQSPSHSQARSPPGSGTVTPSGSQSRGSLAEREAQYLEARNRIFGPSSLMDQAEVERSSGLNARSDASAQCNHSREPTSVTVIRDPLGPPVESSSDQKAQLKGGFCERRRGRNTGQGDGVLCSSARPSRP